jgi:hypothetical protein
MEFRFRCTGVWSQLSGDEKQRLCDGCNKRVHNLDALPEKESLELLKNGACIRATGVTLVSLCAVLGTAPPALASDYGEEAGDIAIEFESAPVSLVAIEGQLPRSLYRPLREQLELLELVWSEEMPGKVRLTVRLVPDALDGYRLVVDPVAPGKPEERLQFWVERSLKDMDLSGITGNKELEGVLVFRVNHQGRGRIE